MQEKRNKADLIIKQIHVKPINVTIKHVTKGIQIIADMETPANFRQSQKEQ